MYEALRSLLWLALAGCFITAAGSGAAFWLDEERRLRRFMRRALGGEPETMILAQGRGRGVGISAKQGRVAVLWEGGARGLIWRLDQLVSAELVVDDEIIGRAERGERRSSFNQVPLAAREIILRLAFESSRDAEVELELWPPADRARLKRGTASETIGQARSWLSEVEAVLHRTAPPARRVLDEPESEDDDEPPWDEDDLRL